MTPQANTSIWIPPQGRDSRDAVDRETLTHPPEAPLDLPALLELSDDDLHDLFCAGLADWARHLNQLERTVSPPGDQFAREGQRGLDRVRDALRAAMWTQHRWITWKLE